MIDFGSLLTPEQKRSLLEQRISQFSAEGYQHTLNRAIAETAGNTEGVEQADTAIAILSDAITVHQNELAKIESN